MKNNIISKLCGGAVVLAFASTVQATPTPNPPVLFFWDSTGANKAVGDNDGTDLDPATATVTWLGTVGNWTVSATTGLSKPTQGNAVAPIMDLNFGAKGNAAGTVSIAFFDNGFGPSGLAGALATIGGTFPGGLGVTLNYSTYTEANNNIPTFLGSGALDLTGFNLLTSHTYNSQALGSVFGSIDSGGSISGGANPYSLLQVITITTDHRMGSAVTGDSTLTVPDGGMTLMLLGSGLTGLALLRRSSKAKV